MNLKEKTRQCISCRTKLDRAGFIRLMKVGSEVIVNPNKYLHGRSAYLCKSEKCISTAIKGKKISRMLKVNDKDFSYKSLCEEVFV